MSYKDFIWFLLSEEDKTSPKRYVCYGLNMVTTCCITPCFVAVYICMCVRRMMR